MGLLVDLLVDELSAIYIPGGVAVVVSWCEYGLLGLIVEFEEA